MIHANQGRTFLRLFEELKPHLRTDRNLPSRIQQRLAREKRFGSRDRRLYRELLYTAVRFLPWIEEGFAVSPERALEFVIRLAADTPATRPLKEALGEDTPALPFSVAEKASALGVHAQVLPDWFREHCPAAFVSPDIDFLHARPSLWLRLQTESTARVFDEFDERNWSYRAAARTSLSQATSSSARPHPLPSSIEILSEADVTQTDAYQSGLVEVQDLGSQLLLNTVRPALGGHWLDACAGAGGKTLQLSSFVGPQGKVDATDPRPDALDELRERARRAGFRNIQILRQPASALYDGVLIDAPCSGTGTWRRSPHLKWCTTESDVKAAAQRQQEILRRHAPLVRPGGLLVYATCSLSQRENQEVLSAFLLAHPEYSPAGYACTYDAGCDSAGGLTFLPSLHNTDGFYVAALQRA